MRVSILLQRNRCTLASGGVRRESDLGTRRGNKGICPNRHLEKEVSFQGGAQKGEHDSVAAASCRASLGVGRQG